MDSGIPFVELMEQKALWEDWYTHCLSGPGAGALSPEDQRLLHMDPDPNKLLDPSLLAGTSDRTFND
jgi:hypothetical protein